MKCGTSTLRAQLHAQPAFYLASPGEPNFFSDDPTYDRGFAWYLSLFEGAPPGAITGEASTHYTKRPTYPKAVERLHAHLPGVRLVYLMRHPIERLVSHYIHDWTVRELHDPLERAIDRHPELVAYGRYAMQLEPYVESYGFERILPVFLERLALRPQREFARICRFLGHPGPVVWRDELERENASDQRLRRTPWRDWLAGHPGVRQALRGAVPAAVRRRLNRPWQMTTRPELDAKRRRALEAVFDADLGILGQWLGIELSCASFHGVVGSGRPLEFTGRLVEV